MWSTLISKQHPRNRYTYAVVTGTYVGEMLVFVEKTDTNYSFLSVPKLLNRDIPIEKFEWALKNKVVDIVEKLPISTYKICVAQFAKNKQIK